MDEIISGQELSEAYSVTARFDRLIFFNPVSKYTIAAYKTKDKSVPEGAKDRYHHRDHLIHFSAVGYDLPQTDALEVTLEGQWNEGKYGLQLAVEQWKEIVPRTIEGIQGYLASGLLKGIGEKTAAAIVERFGLDTLDILEEEPERLLEINGITEERLAKIKVSYAESRMLRDLMTLLSPYKVTPATAQKIYQHFGIRCLDILQKSPYRLCEISGFGFKRVDAIVQKQGGRLDAPMRIQGALHYTLEDNKNKGGHLFMDQEELVKEAQTLLNEKVPLVPLRVAAENVEEQYQAMVLHGDMVAVKGNVYLPRTFALEDETARKIAAILVERPPEKSIGFVLGQVKQQLDIRLSAKQEQAVETAFRYNLSIITGGPGTGKTTVLKTILTVYQRLQENGKVLLAAPTGRASRRMAESTGFQGAKTLHSALHLGNEEVEEQLQREQSLLDADLIIVDETSMVDQWLAKQFFSRVRPGTKIVLVGDADQLPSVGAGSVFRELINCGLIPVTVLDEIFRQAKDSRIAYNAKYINESRTDLLYAATVHKAMGSEYDTIIMPILKAHTILLDRNLVYTAVTRARRKVILVGQKDVLFMAIHREKIRRRNTKLGERIGLYYKAFSKKSGITGDLSGWKEAV